MIDAGENGGIGNNITLKTDGYKLTHYDQYPPGIEGVYSYFESRIGATYCETTFFGLQYLIKRHLLGRVVTHRDVDAGERFAAQYFGRPGLFNAAMWRHIVDRHEGRLPVRIWAAPEGMSIPTANVLMAIENTDPACFALTNHLETLLSQLWYPCTVATLSRKVRQLIARFLADTAESAAGLDFMLHDFGYRGVESVEAAGIGGCAHLVNFKGTDTIAAIECAAAYYNAAEMCAFSVPATEHSVMTALGREGEAEMFKRILALYPSGIVSIVSDSYDIFAAVENIVCSDDLKRVVLAREGTLVIRPDSGDPVTTILRLCEILARGYGERVNAAGFREINPKVRLLWGDGLTYDKIYDILNAMMLNGWSAANISCFGCGGGLLQKMDRDTQRFAIKSSAIKEKGVWRDVWKNPLDTTKASKKGRLALVRSAGGKLRTVREEQANGGNLLELVFENGRLLRDMTLAEIRGNAER